MNFEVARDTELAHKIMKIKVKVRIEKTDFGYAISNDRGRVWEYLMKNETADLTTATGLGSLATSVLTATIADLFTAADKRRKDIHFELTTETFERN